MKNIRLIEVEELIRNWANHGLIPFQGKDRTPEVEDGIRQTFKNAFDSGKHLVEGLGGQEFGVCWGENNVLIVLLECIPEDALIIKV